MPPKAFLMPSANAQEAPSFSATRTGFRFFFRDVADLAVRASLSVDEAIEWACRYAGAEVELWEMVECWNRGEEHPESFKDDSTAFDLFRDQVRSLYPNLQDERQWTNADLRRLTERPQQEDDMTRRDLGEYLRTFIKIAQYLVSQDRLSEREKASRYLDGFPSWLRRAVLHRLLITDPHVIPDDRYPFQTFIPRPSLS